MPLFEDGQPAYMLWQQLRSSLRKVNNFLLEHPRSLIHHMTLRTVSQIHDPSISFTHSANSCHPSWISRVFLWTLSYSQPCHPYPAFFWASHPYLQRGIRGPDAPFLPHFLNHFNFFFWGGGVDQEISFILIFCSPFWSYLVFRWQLLHDIRRKKM